VGEQPAWWEMRGASFPVPDGLRGESFDAVVLHYSFLGYRTIGSDFYLYERAYGWVLDLGAPLVAVPQDEGNFIEVLDEWLFRWRVAAVLSVPCRPARSLSPRTRRIARMRRCLPGYIHEDSAQALRSSLRPLAERPLDLVYRARELPPWIGSWGQMKSQLAHRAVEAAAQVGGLKLDVSTRQEDTVTGEAWFGFLASGRATLGCEGGWSCLDQRGEGQAFLQELQRLEPELSSQELLARMPEAWDQERLFTVTPRHFEAVVTKTAQVLVEGESVPPASDDQ